MTVSIHGNDMNKNNKQQTTMIKFSNHSVQVTDSYKVTRLKRMKEIISEIHSDSRCCDEVKSRNTFSLVNEWCAHNLLYMCKYKRERTADVDFNDESTIRKIAYFFLSIPYRIISFLYII